eukprot:CAMPEP_0183293246 /NCGR_PEP_ID=MMETSP0160_2-20130417/2006_1 /TAXON_ID=2839 ORGANISM="Odontella Sinensis, Strain Grunow 1884" /NCGR_SAMPLE_ID=MMETSP0160_2 /ASSEMBLY_ACC=CAM_ASM_000250 /LENGTH=263 /DNA_ID=CAMNT_0025454333 /DNA_START=104 /DNA_END=895 /DNA_ORIENTATION=-
MPSFFKKSKSKKEKIDEPAKAADPAETINEEVTEHDYEVSVPKGRIDIRFTSKPPTITKILDGSPLSGKVEVGHTICGVVIDDKTHAKNFLPADLKALLMSHSESEKRTLLMKSTEEIADINAKPSVGDVSVVEEKAAAEDDNEAEDAGGDASEKDGEKAPSEAEEAEKEETNAETPEEQADEPAEEEDKKPEGEAEEEPAKEEKEPDAATTDAEEAEPEVKDKELPSAEEPDAEKKTDKETKVENDEVVSSVPFCGLSLCAP